MRRLVLIRSVGNLVLLQTLPPNLSDRYIRWETYISTNIPKGGLQKLSRRDIVPASNYFERSVFRSIQIDKILCGGLAKTKSFQSLRTSRCKNIVDPIYPLLQSN